MRSLVGVDVPPAGASSVSATVIVTLLPPATGDALGNTRFSSAVAAATEGQRRAAATSTAAAVCATRRTKATQGIRINLSLSFTAIAPRSCGAVGTTAVRVGAPDRARDNELAMLSGANYWRRAKSGLPYWS